MGIFPEVRKVETDVLIIGGGVAGMMAAVGAARCGVRPTLITKGTFPSGSSSMARGGFTVAIGHSTPEDNPDFLFEDSVKASYGVCNRRLMRVMSREAIDRTLELDNWGLGLMRLEDGRFHQKKSASHRFPRLVHCGKLMGKPLMATLSKKMKELGIAPVAHVIFVDLMRENGRVMGAWGFHYREGTPYVVHARSTVVATGGAPQLHELNDSPPTITGDGYAMALRAGADLIDMEFIDYQLLTAAPSKIAGYPPHTSGFINAGAYLLNREGDRFMRNYDPERWERSTRAMVNRAVAMEIFEGRGTENGDVFLDARHVIEEVDDGATADIIRVFKNCGVDMRTTLIEVTSGPHTYLGGILIDEWGRTSLEGLYAGGEAAGGVHGANRTGGAALADSFVFGLRAGMGAACESRTRAKPDPESGGWRMGLDLLAEWEARRGGLSAQEWRRELQRFVILSIGQVRHGDRLKEALARLESFEREADDVCINGETPRKRLDCLRQTVETRNLIETSRMLATAALFRKESRGGHFRLDFPDLDDANWTCNILLRKKGAQVAPRRRAVVEDDAAAPEPPGVPSTAASLE